MAQAMMPPDAEPGTIPDDYHIDREYERPGAPVGLQIVRALRAIMVLVLALASIALCWVSGTVIGLW
jgi:hypothetical protein